MSPLSPINLLEAACASRRRARSAVRAWMRAAVGAFAACALSMGAAHAQHVSGGQIYIPGPGETGASAANTAAAANAGAVAGGNANAASGMIVIPGPGEHASQAVAVAETPAPSVALRREKMNQAEQRVTPVIVTSSPRAARAPQPIIVDRPASANDAGISIDPLAARGEPPRLGPNAGASAGTGTGTGTLMRVSMKAVPPTAAPAVPASPSPAQTPVLAPATPAAALAQGQGASAPSGQQDGESIRRVAQSYLEQQTVGLPGKVTVTVAPAFARGLAACTTMVPFTPPGARLWGRTTVGVRCAGERPWTLYLQARVSLEATYYLAARQIEPGSVLTVADLTTREGDLSNLPREIVTDPSQAVGAVALSRISAGMPLRQDMLRSATSVTIGQTVRVVAVGPGFTISSEGSVMNNASPGQQVRVKTPGGQIISGIVKDGSTVEIQM
ncbi:flagella basal body P-ring formation protein FlgA [Trinickia symbiotica]|uniref:Flagellar basal body P-ring formation protein FlgA n=1 Tax=Trinickia symbiotica TaxID=863227 RepID=A0A2N7WN87_9BURK|nr:flagellar basal body P-ring formation chaperone FlgA [Trinickia symbiotica]PMS30812.1 flagellar basal body P-ring formation protein FlgA [Trinickia symbiotica]PPK41517.1 flagella basal body P-ring formation protein FlgA [Trinickia symbiotica]